MRAWIVCGAVLLLAAGCATSGPANDAAPSPVVSIGSPSPSGGAALVRSRAVAQQVEGLLAAVEVPPGSRRYHGPVPDMLSFLEQQGVDDLVTASSTWVVEGTADGVLAFVQEHLPAGLSLESSGGGLPGTQAASYRAAATADDEGAVVVLTTRTHGPGTAWLRVLVQDIWQPVRSSVESVSTSVTGATLICRHGINEVPPPVQVRTVHVGAAVASRIAVMLNALPTRAGGAPDAGGGPDETVTVTFDGDPARLVVTVDGGIYDNVVIAAERTPQPELSDDQALFGYLDGICGPTPTAS